MMNKTELWVENAKGEFVFAYCDDADGQRNARRRARELKGTVTQATYTFEDSELLDDFRDDQTEESRLEGFMKSDVELLTHAVEMILAYFADEMPDVLKIDWEQAHAEVAKWMATERPDDRVPATWEFRNSYESIVAAQRDFRRTS